MKLISQLGIILLLYFIGEFLVFVLHLKIPGSILGMLLLVVALQLNIIKPTAIEEVAGFFLNNMLIFFIPLGVGLVAQWTIISQQWLPIIAATVLSTFIVMLTVGLLINKRKK